MKRPFDPDRIRAVFETIEAPAGMDAWRIAPVAATTGTAAEPPQPLGPRRTSRRAVPVLVAILTAAVTGGVTLGAVALDRPGPPVVAVSPSAAPTGAPLMTPSATPDTSPRRNEPSRPTQPTSSGVGVPPGTRLTTHVGDLRITIAGTVVDGVHVVGSVFVEAPNVTLRRVRVSAAGQYWAIRQAAGGANLTIEDSDVAGDPARTVQYGIAQGAERLTVRRTAVRGVENGVVVNARATVTDSWIVELTPGASTVGIFCFGDGSQLSLQGNTVLAPARANAAIAIYADTGPVSGVSVRDNVLGGGRYALHIGTGVRDVSVLANRFSREVAPRGGTNGAARWDSRPASGVWSGNVWADTGLPVDPP